MKEIYFMTDKERDYVADVFLKNVKNMSSNINYNRVFNFTTDNMDILSDETKEKKPFQIVFGKEFRKVYLSPPYHVGIPVNQLPSKLSTKYKIEILISKLVKDKYYVNPENSTYQNVLDIVKLEISEFVCFNNFFTLLDYLIYEISSVDVKMIYISLISNYEVIEDSSLLQRFLNTNLELLTSVDYEEIPKAFIEKFMYKDTGILLATSLIINNSGLADYFYYYIAVNNPSFLENNNIWMFLAVLISLVDDDKKFKIVEITRDKIISLKNTNSDKFEKTEYFLRAIGLTKEDVI